MERKYFLSVLVENNSGVLCRVAGLFSRRGYNITSLTVGEMLNPKYSRITIELYGNAYILEQIKKQLGKLVEVIKITEMRPEDAIMRELMLVKVKATGEARARIIEICNVFHAKISDLSASTATIEISGYATKNHALLDLLKEFGIIEIARTGITGLHRGGQCLIDERKIPEFEELADE